MLSQRSLFSDLLADRDEDDDPPDHLYCCLRNIADERWQSVVGRF